jgi:hypothetical protein
VKFTDAGNYSVSVSNSVGFATSSNALLIVQFPPALVQALATNAPSGAPAGVRIELLANGNENALGFSLNFDKSLLRFLEATLGSGASGGTLILNTNLLDSGKLGVAVGLPAGSVFAAGTQEVVRVTFETAILTNAVDTPIVFGDSPTTRQVSAANADVLAANYSNSVVSIAAGDFEGDIFPRPNGDKATTISDWVLAGRYAARLDYPTNASEFQRADCAPRETLGDGVITVSDWVQTGRYAVGLDPMVLAGGPISAGPHGAARHAENGTARQRLDSSVRYLVVGDARLFGDQPGTVSVILQAQGNENALSFSLTFDPTALNYMDAFLGNAARDATLYVNSARAASGQLGVVLALPPRGHFAAGNQEVIQLRFGANSLFAGTSPVRLNDEPVPLEVVDAGAIALATEYVSGSIQVNSAPTLQIGRSSQGVSLTWPSSATNFVIQEASTLRGPSLDWTNLPAVVMSTNSENMVTVPLKPSPRFYRLYRP